MLLLVYDGKMIYAFICIVFSIAAIAAYFDYWWVSGFAFGVAACYFAMERLIFRRWTGRAPTPQESEEFFKEMVN